MQLLTMIKQYQLEIKLEEDLRWLKESLNLQTDEFSLYVCHGRIKGNYRIFI